jgi:uncharacterized protein (DUF1499 family)
MSRDCTGLLAMTLVAIASYMTIGKTNVGRNHPKLLPCAEKPNCVSSQRENIGSYVDPVRYRVSNQKLRMHLKKLIHAMPRTIIVESDSRYLHVEFRSAVFGFVDDVEFILDNPPGVLHIRSASRVGYWDFGVNRRRVERIRKELTKRLQNE